ncbi:hypothetical protein LCGC14_0231810 [marine sediment metagenome]|uniref:Rubredoxin-like domain-containing protein n=1 Tax=marine sediment metagenome TaxID=412755 RepID=A0A0F9XE65_9ZZZZ
MVLGADISPDTRDSPINPSTMAPKITELTIVAYKCLGCGHEWREKPRGPDTRCPECDHEYYKWTNFEELANEDAKTSS